MSSVFGKKSAEEWEMANSYEHVYRHICGPKSCFKVSLCVTIKQIFDSIPVEYTPRNFDSIYVDRDGSLKGPVLISSMSST